MPISQINDCASLLREMIAYDTVTPSVSGRPEAERALAEWLASVAAPWGLEVRWLPVAEHAANLLLTHSTSPDRAWILLDSHLDTVGVGGMTIDPFGGVVSDNRIYGRGACDTKGTGAAMLWAAKDAIASGSLRKNIGILFSVGEEHCQIGAQSFVQNDLPNLGWRPQEVIVGEPTLMQAIGASNGFVRSKVVTHGMAAHSSRPELGRNAISDMARVIRAIEDHHIAKLSAAHPLTGRASCSINGIQGGVQHNIVPDRCEIQIDQRLTPGESADEALQSVRESLRPLVEADSGFRYELCDIESAPPFSDHDSLKTAAQVVDLLWTQGIPSGVTGAPYTTNANHYAAAGLRCVVLGPGDIAQAHTADEWVAIEQLELGVRGYRALMEAEL